MMKFDRPGAGRVEVAELLADLALDRQPRHRHAEQAQPEERRLRRAVPAQARAHDAVGGRPADDGRIRAVDDGRAAGQGVRQVADVEVLPLGDRAVGGRRRPVQLVLRSGAVVAAGDVERALGGPGRRDRRGRPACWRCR